MHWTSVKHFSWRLYKAFGIAVLLACSLVAQAQSSRPLDPGARADVVGRLAEHMARQFVFADIGSTVAQQLRADLAAGAYAATPTADALAKQLTARLQELTRDKHLHVIAAEPGAQVHMLGSPRQLEQANFGFERLQRLPGNIGYIDLRLFVDDPVAKERAVASMNWLGRTDALIVDLRRNDGGDPEMIRFIQSYLFDGPTILNTLHWRDDGRAGGFRVEEFRTSAQVTGARYGQKKPVWVLTSSGTFSGGEEFAYNLQSLKRGTIVGEKTGGGAHPGELFALGHGLSAHLSIGRAVNPVTKSNWEGTGVLPDIATPSDQALRRAQIEVLRTLIATEADARRRQALENRVKALEEGKSEF